MRSREADTRMCTLPSSAGGEHSAAMDLQAGDAMGAIHLAFVLAQTAAGLALSLTAHPALWAVGQMLLGLCLVQWFIVLHEAGHMSLFRTRALNIAAGHLASVFALIPFASWRRVHGLHHLWTGWQDKDPTTAALAPRRRGFFETAAVDLAWKLWLPLFSVSYRLGNYWHLPRLLRMFPSAGQRRAIVSNATLLLALYAGLVMVFGCATALSCFGLAIALGLALQDPLILSQHTHIPQPVSGGRRVEPLSGEAQLVYTRSLRFPRWFAQWVLINFNAHELHHRHASVPGYRLSRLKEAQAHAVHWWTWLRAAKRLSGTQFVFGNREQTGFTL